MSEETQEEVVDTTVPVVENQEQPKEPVLKVGYVAGLTTEDELVFNVIGEVPTLLELLGLHKFAGQRIDLLYSQKQGGGDALSLEIRHLVNELNKKMEQLSNTTEDVQSDNKL